LRWWCVGACARTCNNSRGVARCACVAAHTSGARDVATAGLRADEDRAHTVNTHTTTHVHVQTESTTHVVGFGHILELGLCCCSVVRVLVLLPGTSRGVGRAHAHAATRQVARAEHTQQQLTAVRASCSHARAMQQTALTGCHCIASFL
jgi:hypothetical protein